MIRKLVIATIALATLSGCVLVPVDNDHHRHGWHDGWHGGHHGYYRRW